MSDVLPTRLAELQRAGVSTRICERLDALVRESDPQALAMIVPARLADQWAVAPDELLEAFLKATRVGMFDLEWSVRCPSCVGATQQADALARLHSESRCPVCELPFAASFDDAVEVTWRVHPDLRDLSGVDPDQTIRRHIPAEPVGTWPVEPGKDASASLELAAGNYHLIAVERQAGRGLKVHQAPVGVSGDLELDWDGSALDRGDWDRPAGRYRLKVRNRTQTPLTLFVERVVPTPWVSAAQVFCRQSFRDMFSRELIRPGDDFAIRSLAFVFTDLKGSTALYERIGDSRAFSLVRDHFDIMAELVREHGGAIVKTIGDAIMATFLSSAAATRFAFALHRRFARYNSAHHASGDIVVKVGIHRGPCIAVTLNERLDYFGRTVNAAARIQGTSQGGDVVMSKSCAEDAAVREEVAKAGWEPRAFEASLRGIAGSTALVSFTQPG